MPLNFVSKQRGLKADLYSKKWVKERTKYHNKKLFYILFQ